MLGLKHTAVLAESQGFVRSWQVVVAALLLAAGPAFAQDDDPLGDIGEGAAEGEPPPEGEAPPPEGAVPAEGEPPPEGEVPAEGEAAAEGEVAADASLEAGVDATAAADVAEAKPPEPETKEEMVVTGSRIRRSNFAQPSAVQVVDRKQLSQSGAQNMTDVVRTMNINSGSDLNANVNSASPGSAQFNLRGLGVGSTLVLINGRRMTTAGVGTEDGSAFVDINNIPLGVIERVEVLKGGASAIYGSDAVAGVVNIITRKHMDGFEASVGAQTTDDFDQHEWDVSLLGGAESERTRIMGGVTYFKRSPLMAKDREFTDNDRNISTLGWPSTFLQLDPTTFAPMTHMVQSRDPETGMPLVNAMGMPVNRTVGLDYQDPGCGDVPLSAPTPDFNPALNFCTFNFNPYFMLMVHEERVNFYTTVEHDITDHTTAFVELGYARSRASRTLSPAYPLLQPIIIPQDHAYNPTGTPLRWYGRVAGGNSPGYDYDYDSDTFHTVAGIGGDFGGVADGGDEFEWELAGTWSGNRYQVFAQDVLTANLQTALNNCSAGDDPAACWNPFSFGPPNSQTLIDKVTGELRTKTDVQLTTVGLDFTGPIVELPGGDLSFAVGGQMRRETATANGDHDSNQLAYVFLLGGPDWQAERTIFAGYGELLLPFFQGFELQAAGRYENYDDIGQSIDPMVGISWTPATTFMGAEAPQISKLRLRGTYATSFKAPSLLQGDGALTALQEIFAYAEVMNAPTRAARSAYTAVITRGNDDLDPQKSTAITGGIEWYPTKSLLIEADYWNYNYDDIIVREDAQQKIALDYQMHNNPDVRYDATSGAPQQIYVDFINAESVMTHGIDGGIMFKTDFEAEAGTWSFGANGSYVLAYEIPQRSVAPTIWDEEIASCTSPNAPTTGPAPSSATCDVAGLLNTSNFARAMPRLRATIPLGWNMDGHTVTVIGNFIGGYDDDFDSDAAAPTRRNPDPPGTPMAMATPMAQWPIDQWNEEYRPIESWITFDLQYALKIEETEHLATTIKVGVINLLDSDPPAVNIGYGYDFTTHDPRGRLLYARLTQEF